MQDAVALGGIDEGGVEYALRHEVDPVSVSRHGIGAYDAYVLSGPEPVCRFPGSERHAVVVGHDEVDIRVEAQEGIYCPLGRFLLPAGVGAGEDAYPRAFPEHFFRAFLPFEGGSGAFAARDFQDVAPVVQPGADVFAHIAPDLAVVGAYVGRIMRGQHLAVEEDDGDARPVGFFHHGGERFGLVGGDDEQVYLFGYELPDVFDLPAAVVMGVAYADFHFFHDECLAQDFAVHLLAPFVVAALRDADAVFRFRVAARRQQEASCCEQHEEEQPCQRANLFLHIPKGRGKCRILQGGWRFLLHFCLLPCRAGEKVGLGTGMSGRGVSDVPEALLSPLAPSPR